MQTEIEDRDFEIESLKRQLLLLEATNRKLEERAKEDEKVKLGERQALAEV
jgi:hypothetical protein